MFYTSTTLRAQSVSAYSVWDVSGGYTASKVLKGLRVRVGVNNVGNKMPPLAPQAFTDNNVDVATYSPIGRLYFATVEVKF